MAYVPAWLSHTPLGRTIIRAVDNQRQLTIRASQTVIVLSLLFASVNHFWRPTLPPRPLYSVASFPSAAVDYLKQQNFQGNILTPFSQGAYISWTMFPAVRVSLDGRYEVAYQDQVMEDHHRLFNGDANWPALLEKYPCDAVLVEQQSSLRPLLEVFRQSCDTEQPTRQEWRFVYEDDAFAILAPVQNGQPCKLSFVDRRGEPLIDGAWEAFSHVYSFRNRQGMNHSNEKIITAAVDR